jgi:prophage antirepressor-like protein
MLVKFQAVEIECEKIDGEVLFLGSDVAKILGYANSSRTIKALTKDYHQRTYARSGEQGGRPALFLTLSGVVRMAMRSQMVTALAFQDWICDEVVPNILLNGYYIDPNATVPQLEAMVREIRHHQNWTPEEFLACLTEDQLDRRLSYEEF